MADENIVTNIVAKSDFSNLIADLNKVSFSLVKLQEQLAASNKMLASQASVIQRSFADTMRSTGQFSTHFVSLTSDVDKFGSQLDRGQIKLGKFFQVYRQHAATSGGLIRDLAKQQVQLQNAIMQPLGRNAEGLMQYNVHIPRGLDLIKNKSAIAKQELQILNKVVQEGANQLINWGKNTQWAGRQLTVGLTVPLAAFGKASADAFRAADQELTRLTKVYGGIAATSAQELGKVRADVTKTASDISKAYGVSFNETIGLAADIAATGKTGNELLGSIRETTRLAVLGEVDRQDAMKATLAIQSAFKSNTEELADSINFLNSVENQTSTTLNDLVEAIPKAGPIIKGLGGDVQDLALYLTAMREGGVSASEGANALKSGLASLINPTKVAKDMFAGFGISLTDIVQKNAGNTTATLLSLQAALDRLDPLQKQQALEQLFGKFQFARMNALFENLGRQGSQTLQVMDLMKASSQELADLAGRELAQVTESASGKYRRAVEGLKADLAGIGEQFLNINTSLINFVDGIIKFVQKLPDPIKQALGFMGMLTAAAGPLIMLTGVLGNFFGYIIKGAYHFKSLFKGGEGWKLLTPEILAAQKAGNLVEQTFYNDAAAANILKKSIHDLTLEFELLQQRAQSGSIAVNPGIQTAAGNVVMNAGTPRVVNNKSKYLGKPGSRDFSHQNPTAGKTEAEKMAETIFAVTPGTKPVNQRVSANPQIFAQGDLPAIQGLTRVNNVSTGIVATEAAKWHALTGTLSMLTKREVNALKKEIATTGTFSAEISQTFAQLLGPINNITNNAAKQSALIVKQLQQQKITLDVARQRIIELNAQTEALMAKTTSDIAQSLGRTANLTTIPLTNQPVVDASGKSNFKELFRKDRAATNVLSKIASALGVKTWGGSYSTETTIPKKFATGGRVFGGPRSDTTDTQFEYLPVGSFVLNRKASDALLGFNKGGMVPAMVTPGEILIENPTRQEIDMLEAYNNQFAAGGQVNYRKNNYGILTPDQIRMLKPDFTGELDSYKVKPTSGVYIGDVTDPDIVNKYGDKDQKKAGKISRVSINNSMISGTVPGPLLKAAIEQGKKITGLMGSGDQFLLALYKNGIISKKQYKRLERQIKKKYFKYLDRSQGIGDANNAYHSIVDKTLNDSMIDRKGINLWQKFSRSIGVITSASMRSGGEETSRSSNAFKIVIDGIDFGNLKGPKNSKTFFAHTTAPESFTESVRRAALPPMVGQKNPLGPGNFNPVALGPNPALYGIEAHGRNTFLGNIVRKIGKQWHTPHAIAMGAGRSGYTYTRTANRGGLIGLNRGGIVPGYQRGGMVGATLGIAGSMLGYQGGSMLGQQAFGDVGSMVGGIAGSMAVPSLMSKLSSSTNLASTSLGKFAAVGRFLGPWGMAAGAGLTAVAFALNRYKNGLEETERLNRLAFAGGVKPLMSFDTQLKKVRDSINSSRQAYQLFVAQNTKSGFTGINLTVQQFKELQAQVKKTYPDLIKLLNKSNGTDLTNTVAGLKAQFIAAGDSASQATQKVAALITQSNKSNIFSNLITADSVKNITGMSTAIDFLLKSLSAAGARGGDTGFIQSLTQVFSTMDTSVDTLSKTGTVSSALTKQFDAISKSSSNNLRITKDQIKELAKQNPILASMLKSGMSIGDVYAAWRISLAGVSKDLSGLNSNELQDMAKYTASISEYFNKISNVSSKEAQSGPFGVLAKSIDQFNKQQAVAQSKAVQDIQKQIDLKNELIKSIKDEADARKKALQDQQSTEDTKLQIQKEQLAYQDALATGNMSAAAQAQLNIQRLVGQSQLKSATDAIDAEAERKINALQSQIKSLDNTANAVSNSNNTPKESPYAATYQGLTSLLQKITTSGGQITSDDQVAFKAYIDELNRTEAGRALANKMGVKAPSVVDREHGVVSLSGGNLKDIVSKNQDSVAVNTGMTVTKLEEIRKILAKSPDMGLGTGTSSSPIGISYSKIDTSTSNKSIYKDEKTKTLWPNVGKKIAEQYGFAPGTYFSLNGQTYVVKKSFAYGTEAVRAAGGGRILGPGTGTSDSIPAMLSNGEYVINANAVRAVGTPMLDQINKMAMGGLATRYDIPSKTITSVNTMGYNRGGMVQHYNVGGLVINTQPGQNEMEIARMAVNMMNAQNTVASKSIGMNKVIGR